MRTLHITPHPDPWKRGSQVALALTIAPAAYALTGGDPLCHGDGGQDGDRVKPAAGDTDDEQPRRWNCLGDRQRAGRRADGGANE